MACCTGRCLLVVICILQFVGTIERQVFDFLGYMWIPIIGNFLQIIFTIVGFFGAVQFRPRVVIVYALWCLVWLGWNIFVICFYLEVGILKRESPILNIGTGHKSWWLHNGFGCKVASNSTWTDTPAGNTHHIPPEHLVSGCLLEYYHVELIHAGFQCLLALLGFCVGCYVVYVFTEEDDSYGWESQPVHDELEYIKMRYKSPARSSFRDSTKTYETLTHSTFSTIDSGLEAPNKFSDDSADRYSSKRSPHSPDKMIDRQTDLPWVRVAPQHAPPMMIGGHGDGYPANNPTSESQYENNHPYRYNVGHVPGITVI